MKKIYILTLLILLTFILPVSVLADSEQNIDELVDIYTILPIGENLSNGTIIRGHFEIACEDADFYVLNEVEYQNYLTSGFTEEGAYLGDGYGIFEFEIKTNYDNVTLYLLIVNTDSSIMSDVSGVITILDVVSSVSSDNTTTTTDIDMDVTVMVIMGLGVLLVVVGIGFCILVGQNAPPRRHLPWE